MSLSPSSVKDLLQTNQSALKAWMVLQEKKAGEMQGTERPYYGAIGGQYDYSFTPTGVGTIMTVTHALTKEKITFDDF